MYCGFAIFIPQSKFEQSSSIQLVSNIAPNFINFLTTLLKDHDSPVSGSAVFGRPLEETLQVAADVVDRSQVKNAIRAQNRLFSVL